MRWKPRSSRASGIRNWEFRVLTKERIVNDRLGREAVLVIFRPESDTVTTFSRQLDRRALTFEPRAQSGDLADVETRSRWNSYGECSKESSAGPAERDRFSPAVLVVVGSVFSGH